MTFIFFFLTQILTLKNKKIANLCENIYEILSPISLNLNEIQCIRKLNFGEVLWNTLYMEGMIRYFDENESMNDTWGAGHGHWHEMNNTLQVIWGTE